MKKLFALIFFFTTINPMNQTFISHEHKYSEHYINKPFYTLPFNVNVICTRCTNKSSHTFKYSDLYESRSHHDKDLIAITCPDCEYPNCISFQSIKEYICSFNRQPNEAIAESKKIVLKKIRESETTLEESLERITTKKTELKKVEKELNKLKQKYKRSRTKIIEETFGFLYEKNHELKRIPYIKKILPYLKRNIDYVVNIETKTEVSVLSKPQKPSLPKKYSLPQKNKRYSQSYASIKRTGEVVIFGLTSLVAYNFAKKIVGAKNKLTSFFVSLGASAFVTGLSHVTIFNPFSKKCEEYENSYKKYENYIYELKQYKKSLSKYKNEDKPTYDWRIQNAKENKETIRSWKKEIENFEKKHIKPEFFRKNILLNTKYNDIIVVFHS